MLGEAINPVPSHEMRGYKLAHKLQLSSWPAVEASGDVVRPSRETWTAWTYIPYTVGLDYARTDA